MTFLAERGVNAIKVGIGPGGGCTTRITTSFGVPQLQALCRVPDSAGDRTCRSLPTAASSATAPSLEALLFGGDTVMLGSMFAGTEETPGEVVQKTVVLSDQQRSVKVPFKVLRGMASIQAIRDRLDSKTTGRRSRIDRRRRHGSERAGPRIGAADHPGHPEAPVLVDQLRRRQAACRN